MISSAAYNLVKGYERTGASTTSLYPCNLKPQSSGNYRLMVSSSLSILSLVCTSDSIHASAILQERLASSAVNIGSVSQGDFSGSVVWA